MDRNDKGIMRLLTSKQAAESWADGKADGEGVAKLGCKQNNQAGQLIECFSRQHNMFSRYVYERFG